ncbi:hypothetical protein V5F77_02340 [Xanthobacter sp. DSM 24535]|uniref:hypothetical protein n=1 Tax=Roseixanthobacter psychrophilus TaxID=3119917 RepID=UPI00372A9229
MTNLYLILDHDTAQAVRGPTDPGYGLDPVELADGVSWVLPAEALTAPEHAMHHEVLATMLVRAVAPDEWMQPSD